jgi:hypothetical protein
MAHLDSIYRLHKMIELDDTYVGGKRYGKRGRGAEEPRPKGAGFAAMQAVDTIPNKTFAIFLFSIWQLTKQLSRILFQHCIAIAEKHSHAKKKTPPKKASEWLALVHIMIGNVKKFINGTFRGVSSSVIVSIVDYGNLSCLWATQCVPGTRSC